MRYAFSRGAPPVRVLLGVLAIPPNSRYVALDGDEIRVRLGWSFRLTAPRVSIVAALRDHDRSRGIGAHGWRGTCLVTTSSMGLLRTVQVPPQRAAHFG